MLTAAARFPIWDHFPDCYTMVLAGGGVRGGWMHGESDELGLRIARDPVHVHGKVVRELLA